jgi:hypothetical protein
VQSSIHSALQYTLWTPVYTVHSSILYKVHSSIHIALQYSLYIPSQYNKTVPVDGTFSSDSLHDGADDPQLVLGDRGCLQCPEAIEERGWVGGCRAGNDLGSF